ncbi:MAG: hypothetical protein SNH27_14530 [Rikenellaceae bacterium]
MKILHNKQIKDLKDIILVYFDNIDEFSLVQTDSDVTFTFIESYTFVIQSHIITGTKVLITPNLASDHIGSGFNLGKNVSSFSDVRTMFEEWIKAIQEEVENEGIWDKATGFSFKPLDAGDIIGEKFSDEERIKLKAEIEILRQELSEREDLKESIMHINLKLDVLGELVSELSKVSWRDHAIGAMMGLVADGLATNDEVKSVASKLVSFVSENISKLTD